MSPIRLLIVEDHDFFRHSILSSLEMEPLIQVVGEAVTAVEAVDLCRSLQPDVVLMDLNLPIISGFAALLKLRSEAPAPAVLVLTGMGDEQSVRRAFAAGAQGYMRKDVVTDDLLLSAILTVASGGIFLDALTFMSVCNWTNHDSNATEIRI